VLNDAVNLVDPSGQLVPIWHWRATYVSALRSGRGFRESWKLAWDVVTEDRNATDRSASASNIHAMAGELSSGQYQSPAQALARANEIMRTAALPTALHTAQDYPVHNGESMEDFGWNWSSIKHVWRDIWPGLSILIQAHVNTVIILDRAGSCN
jgi:hypothetical protein